MSADLPGPNDPTSDQPPELDTTGALLPLPDVFGDTLGGQAHVLAGTLAGYRVVRLIGRGGMGVVYECLQSRPHRRVAVKLMRSDRATDAARVRFEREGEVLGRLLHPGIAQVYETGSVETPDGPCSFIAMEYVDGVALTTHAASAALSTRQCLELMVRVCRAVEHAHQRGVIHRDLKPGNILVTATSDPIGQPKVLDFGIARLTDHDLAAPTMRTDVGELVGTIAYMSPEQASGNPAEIDTRSDVYSLGVILYELLSGRLPHDVRDRMLHDAVRAIREEEPTRLSSTHRGLRGDVETIVQMSLVKEKRRRYQSVGEFAADIERYLRDEPIAARPASAAYQLTKFAQRHKALVAGAAATTLAVAAGFGGTLWGLLESRRSQADALRQRDVARASLEFFVKDLLGAVDPEIAQGRTITVQEVADAARERLATRFAGRPEIEAPMRVVLGQLDTRLSRFKSAVEQADAAIALYRALPDTDATDLRGARLLRLEASMQLGDIAGYESEVRQLIDDATIATGASSPETLQVRDLLTTSLYEQGKTDAAAANARAAFDDALSALGTDSPQTARLEGSWVMTLAATNDRTTLFPAIQSALERSRRALGENDPWRLSLLHNAGVILSTPGSDRIEEGIAMLREAIARRTVVFGAEHNATLLSRMILALVQRQQGKPAEALADLRAIAAAQWKIYPEGHGDIATTMCYEGDCELDLGRLADAAATFVASRDLAERTLGPVNGNVALALLGELRARIRAGDPTCLATLPDRIFAAAGEPAETNIEAVMAHELVAVDAELRNDAATAARHRALERGVPSAKLLPRITAEIDALRNARPGPPSP